MKDQCSFPLHCWLSVAAVVFVVVAVAVVVAEAIDVAEPEPGRDAAPAGLVESGKDHCQMTLMPMKVTLMNSFDEILLPLLALLTETDSRFRINKF